ARIFLLPDIPIQIPADSNSQRRTNCNTGCERRWVRRIFVLPWWIERRRYLLLPSGRQLLQSGPRDAKLPPFLRSWSARSIVHHGPPAPSAAAEDCRYKWL